MPPRRLAQTHTDAGGADHALLEARGLDARMLARVRALLAKAESTEFDEEAEALTPLLPGLAIDVTDVLGASG